MFMGEKLKSGTIAILLMLAFGVMSSGCGRKGALEPPPGTVVGNPAAAEESNQPAKPDEPFILDPLI